MKLKKVAGGWYVEPETSTEQEHLRYLLEGLAGVRSEATPSSPLETSASTMAAALEAQALFNRGIGEILKSLRSTFPPSPDQHQKP